METRIKNLIALIISLIAFLIVLVMYLVTGIGITVKLSGSTTTKIVGWIDSIHLNNDKDITTFTNYAKNENLSFFSKGIAVFSILAFIFILLLTIYFSILTITSFMGKEIMEEKVKMIIGLTLTSGLIIFGFLFMLSSFTILYDLNKMFPITKEKLTGVSYITMFFPIICGAGLIYPSIKLM